LPNELRSGTCTIFNSPAHENRPVVFAGGRYTKAQLLDYSLENTWEESKYESRIIRIIYGIIINDKTVLLAVIYS